MTPRAFVDSLREPVSVRMFKMNLKAARLAEIDSWFTEGGEKIWGAGGAAFMRQARAQALSDRGFEQWLDSLPKPKQKD